MLVNLKAMIVVLTVALTVFVFAKSECLRFIAENDYVRRRNVWLILTAAAFVSPNIWLYALLALPLLFWAGRRDTNPVALYVLAMQVIPPTISVEIPGVIVNKIFDLTNYRILSLAILLPATLRLLQEARGRKSGGLGRSDVMLLGYLGLQLLLLMPYESSTHTLRRAFLATIDVFLVYFTISRANASRGALLDTIATFALASTIYALLAVVETLKGWLLYGGIGAVWGSLDVFGYLFREGRLRAEVSAGHSITLGYMLAISFGFFLYLRAHFRSRLMAAFAPVCMWIGMIAAYARSPWVVAVCVLFAFWALSPAGLVRVVKGLIASAIIAGVVLASPIGPSVIENLPFVGAVGAETVSYRQRVAEESWRQIQEHPILGNPLVLKNLEDLRQGQGIIDLMNTYTNVAMFYGLIGLALFMSFFLTVTWKAYGAIKASRAVAPDDSRLGASLVACMAGSLVMMATGSFGGAFAQVCWVLAGLTAGYAQFVRRQHAERSRASVSTKIPAY